MELSVIIVSYNVKYFLEQCLNSVSKAIAPIKAEVIVIDNNSIDESVLFLQPRFPFVRFICNKENSGFAIANNKALQLASGRFILFLNPDTIVPENCFTTCLAFLEQNSEAGALGIRMIDGGGVFLKESKRGFPTIWASFCKMTGLTNAFPSSKLFASYYMGHLRENQNHEIDALSGAFLMAKKEVLDLVGGFDERFFMYAEDIDLSYRIKRAGFRNLYFSENTIVHFKGESTDKDLAYIRHFYKAMIQFVQKHYSIPSSILLSSMLYLLIAIKMAKQFLYGSKGKSSISSLVMPMRAELKGDNESILEVSEFVVQAEKAENIILCTGKNFSALQMINHVQANTGKKTFFFHAFGTESIISSDLKESKGIVLKTKT